MEGQVVGVSCAHTCQLCTRERRRVILNAHVVRNHAAQFADAHDSRIQVATAAVQVPTREVLAGHMQQESQALET